MTVLRPAPGSRAVVALLLGAVLLTAAPACRAGEQAAEARAVPGACTLLPVEPALRVTVADVPAGETVHVSAVARGPLPVPGTRGAHGATDGRGEGRCVGVSCAAPGVAVVDFAPDTAEVTVVARGVTARHVVTPRYRVGSINGPGCEPVARVGHVVLPYPAP